MNAYGLEGKSSVHEDLWVRREGIYPLILISSKGSYLPMNAYEFEWKASAHEVLWVRKEAIYP